MERRTLLKTVSGIGAATVFGGAGLLAATGGAAASEVNITAGNPSVSNDRGDLSALTVGPDFDVSWSNLDDAVGKIFFLLEAKVGDGEFQPIYRATPWLSVEQMGTTGSYTRAPWTGGITVADEQGKPDYSAIDFTATGRTSYETFMDGTSMGSASAYAGLGLQNNFPDQNAGYYGAASDTTPFDNTDDQSTGPKTTTVTLRYTLELQRPNLSQLGYSDKQTAAAEIDALEESDIDAGNSAIVMSGEDGYADFSEYADGAGIPYDVLQQNSDHPGIIVETATMNVGVTNETADTGATGSSGGDAS